MVISSQKELNRDLKKKKKKEQKIKKIKKINTELSIFWDAQKVPNSFLVCH